MDPKEEISTPLLREEAKHQHHYHPPPPPYQHQQQQQQQQQQHIASHEYSVTKPLSGYSVLRARVVTLLVPTFYFCGIIPYSVLLPQYLVYRFSKDAGHSTDNTSASGGGGPCEGNHSSSTDSVQSQASDQYLYYSYASSGPAFLGCLFLGGFGDVYGRRPLLLLATLTGALKMLAVSLCIRFNLPLWAIYIPNAVEGLSGSWFTMFIMLCSTISDIFTNKSERVFSIALLECSIAVTSSVFMVLSGFIIDALGYFASSLLCVGPSAISFILALLLYPETLQKTSQTSANRDVFFNVRRVMGYFFTGGTIRKRVSLWLGIVIFMFSVMNLVTIGTIDALYQKGRPFCWDSFYIGIYTASRLGGQFLLSIICLRGLQKCFRSESIGMSGLVFMAAAMIMEAFVTKSWQFVLVPVIGTLGTTTVPIVRGIISTLASSADQGVVYSSVGMVEVLCNIISATGILRVYSATVSTMPGAAYLLMASFSITAFLLFCLFLFVREDNRQNYEAIVDPVINETNDDRVPSVGTVS